MHQRPEAGNGRFFAVVGSHDTIMARTLGGRVGTFGATFDLVRIRSMLVLALGACAGGDATSSTTTIASTTIGSGGSTASSTGDEPEDTSAANTDDGTSSASMSTDPTGVTSSAGDTESGPCDETTWYFDGDGDGRGDPNVTISACEAPMGYVPFGDDCDDTDPARNVSASEVCDGVDNDCDMTIDEATATNTACNGCTLFAANGRSYAFCPAGASWDGGRTLCAAFSGDLLRLDDEVESGTVVQFAEPASAQVGGWFIGLSDSAGRGAFVWVDGGGLDFASWLAGEPNDGGGAEDCVEMDPGRGGWNDVPCAGPRAFICESGGA